jgi:hypothetical protein
MPHVRLAGFVVQVLLIVPVCQTLQGHGLPGHTDRLQYVDDDKKENLERMILFTSAVVSKRQLAGRNGIN